MGVVDLMRHLFVSQEAVTGYHCAVALLLVGCRCGGLCLLLHCRASRLLHAVNRGDFV